MKSAIVYYSAHHGNTKQLVEAIAEKFNATLIDAAETKEANLSVYDAVGFASGIYAGKFHKTVLAFADANLPTEKPVFFIYTCGMEMGSYTKSIEEAVAPKKAKILGSFGCKAFNTFGPFKLVGGTGKGHPDSTDIANVLKFYQEIESNFKV